jgi:type VI secretion system protein ImpE
MNASELFKAGKLQEAIEAQIKEVKANPADHAKRLFLFELLAFAGDLDRARRHIEAVNYSDLELDTAVLAYRKLLDAEQARRRLFSDGLTPQFLTEPPDYIRVRLEAVNRLRAKRPGEARELLEQVNTASPPLQGQLNDKPFTLLRDCDDLFAGVLEVMAHGNYYWVPLEQVVSVTMKPPRFPRDLLWVSARLELRDATGDVFLPVLYPGSHEHPDNQIKLGRSTDWKGAEGEPILGVGLRSFLVGDDAVSLLEWRHLQIDGSGSSHAVAE